MKEVAASEAKSRFGRLLDAAQSAPVRVTRKGRAVGVMMSVQQYERLRGVAWERRPLRARCRRALATNVSAEPPCCR